MKKDSHFMYNVETPFSLSNDIPQTSLFPYKYSFSDVKGHARSLL